MVDVGSLLQKLEKSERVRAEIEQKLQLLEEKTGGTLFEGGTYMDARH